MGWELSGAGKDGVATIIKMIRWALISSNKFKDCIDDDDDDDDDDALTSLMTSYFSPVQD